MHRLLLALTCLLGVHGAAVAQSAGDRPVITVTLLGTGAPPPLADRFGPATLVQAGGQTLLFDAGRGSTIRLWQLAVPGSALTATFLTHLHSDLDASIEALMRLPQPDQLMVARLKRKKLVLRDEIVKIEAIILPDIIA